MCDTPLVTITIEADQSDCDNSSSSSGTFEGFGVFAARLNEMQSDPDAVISHLMEMLEDVNYSTAKCHLCEWVDSETKLSDVCCRFCQREHPYCDACSSEIYIEDIDDYCCRECAVEKAAIANESGKRVSVTTGRIPDEVVVKRLKFTMTEKNGTSDDVNK